MSKQCTGCKYRSQFALSENGGGMYGCGYLITYGVKRERGEHGECLTYTPIKGMTEKQQQEMIREKREIQPFPQEGLPSREPKRRWHGRQNRPAPPMKSKEDEYNAYRMYLHLMA